MGRVFRSASVDAENIFSPVWRSGARKRADLRPEQNTLAPHWDYALLTRIAGRQI